MSRFQEAFSSIKYFFSKERGKRCDQKIRGFDLLGPWKKYSREIVSLKTAEANQRLRSLLELNMQTYVQEAVGESQITQIATAVKDVFGQRFFQDSFYDDVEEGLQQAIEVSGSNEISERYCNELNSWRLVWSKHLSQIEALDGVLPEKATSELSKKGFSHLWGINGLIISKSMASLYPSLKEGDRVEAYKSPQALLVASPNFKHYHNGETTIARYSRFYFLPKQNEWVILEDGLFTAYSNEQIKEFLKLDDENKKLPENVNEFFQFVAVLSKELSALPAHAVFKMVIDQLGEFPEIPTGKNVKTQLKRNYQTQLELIEKIFDLELEWQKEFSQMKTGVEQRLVLMTEVVEHSLLRANDLAVSDLLKNYQQMFAPSVNQEPKSRNQKEFRMNMIKIYPDFATRVQSLIDCGSGGILGGVQNLSPNQLQTSLGFDRWNIISTLTGENIVSRNVFESIARKLGKNPRNFDHLGHCQMCGAYTFLGSCDVCVLCEYKDDLGISSDQLAGASAQIYANPKQKFRRGSSWRRPYGLSEFVATMV